MDIELINKIKRLAIIALASDDELVETIVLKGGNAIDLLFKDKDALSRTSYDLDYSVDKAFSEDEESIMNRIKNTLEQTFLEYDLVVIDYKFERRPGEINPQLATFWGGYNVLFKVLKKDIYEKYKDNILKQRNYSIKINKISPKFELEFSKFEYVEKKMETKVDGFKLYIYTPEMIVFEKLRAICQQLPDYTNVIPSHSPRPRARDFYDIHLIMEMHKIKVDSSENIQLIKDIFLVKKVPLNYIKEIRNHKYIHEEDWISVKDTTPQLQEIEDFDYYFNYVLDLFEDITFPSDNIVSI